MAKKPVQNKRPKGQNVKGNPKKGEGNNTIPPSITEEYTATAQAESVFRRYTAGQGIRLFSVLGVALACSLALNFYNASKPTHYSYIAVTPDGRIIPLVPLSQPLPSSFDIGFWSTQKAQQLFTLDYQNYRNQLSASEQYFTSAGWRAFEKALGEQNLIGWIQQNRYVIRTALMDAPVIESQGILGASGMYGWDITFHIKLDMSSGNGATDQEVIWKVNMLVLRSPQTISPDGVQIQNLAISKESG